MIFGDSKGFFRTFKGFFGFSLDSQGSSDFFSIFGMVYEIFASDTPLGLSRAIQAKHPKFRTTARVIYTLIS